MKKTISLILALIMGLSLAFFAVPAQAVSVVRSPQRLTVDGKEIACDKYNIDGSNYFKLRDLAQMLNGTDCQFDVGWDQILSIVSITTDHAYTAPDGSELVVGADQSATAQVSRQSFMINGQLESHLSVYNIGGNNYLKLRDLGAALRFTVDFDKASNTAIVESKKLPKVEVLTVAPRNVQLSVGETSQLTASVTPAAAGSVVWSSNDEKVATVDQNGLVTAKGSGSTYVLARVGTVFEKCTVQVSGGDAVGYLKSYCMENGKLSSDGSRYTCVIYTSGGTYNTNTSLSYYPSEDLFMLEKLVVASDPASKYSDYTMIKIPANLRAPYPFEMQDVTRRGKKTTASGTITDPSAYTIMNGSVSFDRFRSDSSSANKSTEEVMFQADLNGALMDLSSFLKKASYMIADLGFTSF